MAFLFNSVSIKTGWLLVLAIGLSVNLRVIKLLFSPLNWSAGMVNCPDLLGNSCMRHSV
jgi:hypothetical protein